MRRPIRTKAPYAWRVQDFLERCHLHVLFRNFEPSDMIAFFMECPPALERELDRHFDFDKVERDYNLGLLTTCEYQREQWWAEVRTCAVIALERITQEAMR